MNRVVLAGIVLFGGAVLVATGWVAHGFKHDRACRHTSSDYEWRALNVRALDQYPLEKVNDNVVSEIQRCWAAHPYQGPQHVLMLQDARKAQDGGYFLLFDSWGVSDVQVVFSVDGKDRVTGAFLRSTF